MVSNLKFNNNVILSSIFFYNTIRYNITLYENILIEEMNVNNFCKKQIYLSSASSQFCDYSWTNEIQT